MTKTKIYINIKYHANYWEVGYQNINIHTSENSGNSREIEQ